MPAPKHKEKQDGRAGRQEHPAPEGGKESYYARNSIARRRYQVQYNQVRRVTRRKLGRAQLAALHEKKWQELKGITPLFKNTICRKDGALDPDRTPRMIYREDLTVKYCQFLRLSFADEHALRDDPDAWIEEYLEELASQIELELRAALRYIEVTSEVKGSAEWNEMVHGWRRLIALRHQERELIKQGLDIPLLARQSNASIAQGICVNKREFRRLYGF